MGVFPASLGPPSLGSASQSVDCGGTQVGDVRRAFKRCVSDVGAGVMVDGECDGHNRYHKRTDIGHGTRQRFGGSVTRVVAK